ADLCAGPRRLSSISSRQSPFAFQYTVSCDPCRWPGWHRGDLQRLVDYHRRAAVDGEHCHHVRAWCFGHVCRQHVRTLPAAHDRAAPFAAISRTTVSVRAYLDATLRGNLYCQSCLLQSSDCADVCWPAGCGIPWTAAELARKEVRAGGCRCCRGAFRIVSFSHTTRGRTYRFEDLKTLLAKA